MKVYGFTDAKCKEEVVPMSTYNNKVDELTHEIGVLESEITTLNTNLEKINANLSAYMSVTDTRLDELADRISALEGLTT